MKYTKLVKATEEQDITDSATQLALETVQTQNEQKKPKRELVYYIQGNFGCGWEDVSAYPLGYRQVNYRDQMDSLRHDLKEYRLSGQGVYRVIKRYELIEE